MVLESPLKCKQAVCIECKAFDTKRELLEAEFEIIYVRLLLADVYVGIELKLEPTAHVPTRTRAVSPTRDHGAAAAYLQCST
jgi:hypothetical protein